MPNTLKLRKVGLRVYLDGLGAKVYVEPGDGTIRVRIDNRGMWLGQRLATIEKARQELTRLNSGQMPQTMNDVIGLL